jgi:hypothetical protein
MFVSGQKNRTRDQRQHPFVLTLIHGLGAGWLAVTAKARKKQKQSKRHGWTSRTNVPTPGGGW